MIKITNKLSLLAVSILFCFAFFSIGVNAEEHPEEAVPVASVETEAPFTETETVSPIEEISSEVATSVQTEEIPATFSADPDEAKTFNDYFPDPYLADAVAGVLGKNSEQITNKDELQSIIHLRAAETWIPYGSKITNLEGIENLENLEELGIESNYLYPLTTLPDSFCTLKKLRVIRFRSELSTLPENFGNLSNLEELNLNYNLIEELPNSFWNLKNLKILSIIGNTNKVRIPNEIGQLLNLEKLLLSTDIPESVGNLSKLYELRFDTVSSPVPESIGDLKNLRKLSIIGIDRGDISNGVTELPESIGELTNLEYLEVSYNSLSKLPKSISKLSNLKTCSFPFNKLTEVPDFLFSINNFNSSLQTGIDNSPVFIPEKSMSLSDLNSESLLPQLILQENKFSGGKVTGKLSLKKENGEIIDFSVEDILMNKIDFSTTLESSSQYKVSIETNSFTAKSQNTLSGGWSYFTYDLILTDSVPKSYSTPFTASGKSENDTYDLAFSGTLAAELVEGENILDAAQMAGIEVKGTAVDVGGTVGVWNQSKVTNAKVTVFKGEITDITLYGNAKTTTSKQDTFIISTSAQGETGTMFHMTGTSDVGQYTITLAGNLPTNLKEGTNKLDPTAIKALKLYGIWYRDEDGDSKFFTQTNVTSLTMEVKDGKIIKITATGNAKTATGTKEVFSIIY